LRKFGAARDVEISPGPSFPKRGNRELPPLEKGMKGISGVPPLKKGDKGGFLDSLFSKEG
jgi:hypothetical protein